VRVLAWRGSNEPPYIRRANRNLSSRGAALGGGDLERIFESFVDPHQGNSARRRLHACSNSPRKGVRAALRSNELNRGEGAPQFLLGRVGLEVRQVHLQLPDERSLRSERRRSFSISSLKPRDQQVSA
jgi:hypothetical protein